MRASLLLLVLALGAGCVPDGRERSAANVRVERDAGHAGDAAPDLEDAGFAEDAALPTDAGSAMDAGLGEDAALPIDAGSAMDAGRIDAGSVPVTGRHIYSQLQAWSSDGVYFLAVDIGNGQGVVYHAGTFQEVVRLGRRGHRWITGTRQILMFDAVAGTGAALYAHDLDTGRETELLRLGHPTLRAGRSHEEMDRAGRWVAVYIERATSGGPRIVTADVIARRIGADIPITAIGCDFEPDWVGVDPTGQFLLVQSVRDGRGPCSGLWAHDINTGAALRQLTEHRNHGSTGLGPNGRPYFLSIEIAHPNDNGSPGLFRYWIDDGRREVVGPPLPWGALNHISCLGGPGEACLVSGGDEFPSQFAGQIWRLAFDGTRTVVEPHHAQGCGYWGEAHVTLGPGGRYAFATHGGSCNRIRSLVVQ